MHGPVWVAHSLFIEGSHMTKNTASGNIRHGWKWVRVTDNYTITYNCRNFIVQVPTGTNADIPLRAILDCFIH